MIDLLSPSSRERPEIGESLLSCATMMYLTIELSPLLMCLHLVKLPSVPITFCLPSSNVILKAGSPIELNSYHSIVLMNELYRSSPVFSRNDNIASVFSSDRESLVMIVTLSLEQKNWRNESYGGNWTIVISSPSSSLIGNNAR
jgi:hypothetical protein